MIRIFKIVVVLSLMACAFGCARTSSDEPANANVAAESQFAGITDANIALAEGNRLLDDNQTELAIEAFRQAVKLDPDLAEGHFKLGIAYSLLEMQMQQSGVVGQFETDSKDGKSKPRSELAFKRAVAAYKKWVETNPKDDAAYYNLGRAYAKLLKDEEAADAFRQAVKLKPEDTEYQTELGAILIRLAQYHEAIGPLTKAVELDPENVRAEDLLEDAKAGRQRVDYVPPKNTNSNANKDANANVNANLSSNSNSNSAPRPQETNTKPRKEEPKANKPPRPANKPK